MTLPEIPEDFSKLKWTSFGKDGRGPAKTQRLIDLSTDHLEAILKNCPHIKNTIYERAIRTLLEC